MDTTVSSNSLESRWGGTLAVAAANLIWGFSVVATKSALGQINPYAVLLLRLPLSAALILAVVAAYRGNLLAVLTRWRDFLPLALTAVTGSQVLFLVGLSYTSPAHSALMYSLLPIFTAVLALFFLRERITALRAAGIGLAFLGAVILATEKGINPAGAYLVGDLITLGAALCWACFTVLSKPVVMRLGAIPTLAGTLFYGALLTLPIVFVPSLPQRWETVTPLDWSALAFLIVFGTVAAQFFYQFSLKHLSAAIVAAFTYSQPVLATIFSVLLLREELTAGFFTASAFIFLGLIVARRRQAAV